jgi:hypothetical protein
MRTNLIILAAVIVFGGFFIASADEESTSKYSIFEDADQDGLSDAEEATFGTDPSKRDTDGDGYSDGVEIESGYDPKIAAPGDRIVAKTDSRDGDTASLMAASGEANETAIVGEKVVTILESNISGGEEITMESLEKEIQSAMDVSAEEIVLPEVNIDDIKIRKIKNKSKLDDDELAQTEKEHALEYLTTIAYLFVNNSPTAFSNEKEMESVATGVANGLVTAMISGDQAGIDELAGKAETVLEDLNDIEVPESMLESHVKALKLVKYAMSLKDDFSGGSDDPIGSIKSIAKVQGVIASTSEFVQEVSSKISELGIDALPIDL